MSNRAPGDQTPSLLSQDTFDEFWKEQLCFEAEMEEHLNRLRAGSHPPEYLAKRKAKDQYPTPQMEGASHALTHPPKPLKTRTSPALDEVQRPLQTPASALFRQGHLTSVLIL